MWWITIFPIPGNSFHPSNFFLLGKTKMINFLGVLSICGNHSVAMVISLYTHWGLIGEDCTHLISYQSTDKGFVSLARVNKTLKKTDYGYNYCLVIIL